MEEPVLVSKYIANPLLVDGHKVIFCSVISRFSKLI